MEVIFFIIPAFLIVFPLFWCLIVWFLSHVGGWQRLAKHYAAGDRPVTGEAHYGVRGAVGLVSYRYTLTVYFNPDGFLLETMPLFRVGHRRLFIPWSAISARKPHSILFWKSEILSIGSPVIAKLMLPAALLADHPALKT